MERTNAVEAILSLNGLELRLKSSSEGATQGGIVVDDQ
jgi:hypothetical protein